METPESRSTRGLFRLKFKQEGPLASISDEAYLDELEAKLQDIGLNPFNLVFSGFDGTRIKSGRTVPLYPYIFGMNDAGWRYAKRIGEQTPADYAAGYKTPCIGVYDKSLLREVYSHEIKQLQYVEEVPQSTNVVPTDPSIDLSDLLITEIARNIVNANRLKQPT